MKNEKLVIVTIVVIIITIFSTLVFNDSRALTAYNHANRVENNSMDVLIIETPEDESNNDEQVFDNVENVFGIALEEVTNEEIESVTTKATEEETNAEVLASTEPEVETKVEEEAKTKDPEKYSMPYYIEVNIRQNVVNIYVQGSGDNHDVPYKAMACSTGTYTPKAGSVYKITNYRNRWNLMKGGVYAQYAVQIVGNILFHSVPYTKKNNHSLEYWEYDKLGTKASLGCIRLTTEDAKWMFENVEPGTLVLFYENDDPGPLGKPVTQKISDNVELRGWDPTDDVPENPWKTHSPEEPIKQEEIDKEVISNPETEETIDIINDSFEENIIIEDVASTYEFEDEIEQLNAVYSSLSNEE